MRKPYALHKVFFGILIALALLILTPPRWRATAAPHFESKLNRSTARATSAAPIPRKLTDDHNDGETINPTQSQNGTWGPGVLSATSDVTILPGVVITISPGTTISVAEGVTINIEGNLHSSGPLTFTTANASPTPGDWNGIVYAPDSSGYLNHAIVQYAEHAITLNTTRSITIANSELRYNRYTSTILAAGAGLYIAQGNPLITGTHIHHNIITATGEGEVYGGGIYIENGSPRIINTHVYENTATGERAGAGGGIGIREGNAVIQNSVITTNTIQGSAIAPYNDYVKMGGGIGFVGFSDAASALSTHVEIRNNLIASNRNIPKSGLAGGGGIGFGAYASATLIDSNRIIDNQVGRWWSSYGEGGGIDAWLYNDFIASNNLVYGNVATERGGGIFLNGTAKAFHNTIVNNTADDGGGVYRQDNQQQVFNNIVVDNLAYNRCGGIFLQEDSGSAGYNNVWRNDPNNYDDPRAIPATDYQVDPWFVGEGDIVERYHLLPYSPLTDVATDTLSGLLPTDYDGDERPRYIGRDIGFDEVVLNPDLPVVSIQKSSPFLGSGEVLEYTILIVNNTGVTYTTRITDLLPAYTTYDSGPSANLSGTGSYDETHNRITWESRIPPYLFLNLHYRVLVDIGLTDGTKITNTATISMTNLVTSHTFTTNTNVVTTSIFNPEFKLSQQPIDNGSKIAGTRFSYRIEAQNISQSGRATNVVLTNTLPAYVYFGQASGGGVQQGDAISWTIPFIAAGGVTWRTAEISACQSFTNTLYRIITSTQLVSSTWGPAETYTITDPTLDAAMDPIPPSVKIDTPVYFTSTSTTNGSGLTALWDFGDGITATGKTVAHTYVASNTYTVTLTIIDGCGFTDTETVSINVYTPPLRVQKSTSSDVKPGKILTYTLIVLSEAQNTNIVISDTLSANTTFLTNSITLDPETAGEKGSAPPILARAITLTSGQRVTLTYAAVVTSPLSTGTRIVNNATVTSTEVPTPTQAAFTSVIANASPEILTTTRTITENAPLGADVGLPVTGTDTNQDPLTYALVAGNPEQAFSIHASTGQITVSGALDYESQSHYILTVQVSDGTLTDTASVTVTVLDVNEAPLIQDATRTISENVPIGTDVGEPITGTDVDTGDALTYTLISGDAFALHPHTGQITVNRLLDYEAQDQYTLTVQVSDSALTATANVTIAVLDVNEAPVIQDATRTITENVALGTQVGDPITGTDVDGGNEVLTYTITDGNLGSVFALHPSTGQLTVSGALDHETTPQYTLRVQITDGALIDTATVTITVLDTNDAPTIADATRTITENAPLNTNVGNPITGSDEDLGDTLSYTLMAGHGESTFALHPHTGQITVNRLLDYETQDQYTLTVQVSDSALTATANVTITVLDVNEAPVIQDATRTVTENVALGTRVGDPITGSDVDNDDVLTHTIADGNSGAGFAIHPSTGQLTVNGSLDHETRSQYTLAVQVTDGALADTARVTITVLDANERPIFTSLPLTEATEDTPYTYTITTDDEDNGDFLTIQPDASAPALPNWLTLTQTGNGTAILQGTPTNADVSKFFGDHAVSLQVSDQAGLTDTQSFTITVHNVNDAPQFISTAMTTATEDIEYTYAITATDPDQDDILTITTSVLPSWLTLTPTGNGTAQLRGTPDDKDLGEHPVELLVRDTSGLTVTQRFTLRVRSISPILKDINLYPATTTIQAGESQTYTVEAIDKDGDYIGDLSAAAAYTITPKAGGYWTDNVYTAESAGIWTITTTYRITTVATATLTITPSQSRHLNLDYSKETIIAGEAQVYTTEASDTFGNRWDVTSDTTYTITPEAGGHWTDNVYTSEVAGTWIVTATYQGTVTTMTLTVIPGPTTYLNLSPAQATITKGQIQTYTLIAADAFYNTWDATANAHYEISPKAGGTWSNNVYISEIAGIWTVTATYHTLTATATLSVTPDMPTSIALTPAQVTVSAGDVQTYSVNAFMASGNILNVTDEATYAITSQAKGTWSDNVYTSEVAGTWTVTATYQTLIATATLSVTPNTPTSIALTPSQATLTAGETQAYHVSAIDPFGNTWDVTPNASYTISPQAGGWWSDHIYTSEIAGTWIVTGTYLTMIDTATLNVQALADLTLAKFSMQDSIRPGDTLLYTLLCTNTGDLEPKSDAILTETIPAHTTFDAAMSVPGWRCQPNDNAGSTCTYPLTDLAGGASRSITFAVTVDPSLAPTVQQISNTASVGYASSSESDPTPNNNTATVTTIVQHDNVDLVIHKTNDRDIVHPGDVLIYTLTITNNSTIDVTGVRVTDTLPTQVTFIQASHGGTLIHPDIYWPPFDLSSGVSTSRLVTVTVNDAITETPTGLTNIAHVLDDGRHGTDVNPQNNRAEDTDTVQRRERPDLILTKQVLEQQVHPGDQLHYTLTVQNVGTATASQATITDILPPYVTLITATPGGRPSEAASNSDVITWTASELSIGEQKLYTITALIAGQILTDNLSLVNHAEARMDVTDPTPDNNFAIATTQLTQHPTPPTMLYLPLITRNYTPAPDLIITSVIVTDDNVQITIRNAGERSVVNAFWVDLYINPDPIPTGVNELWNELGEQGALWGVSRIPLRPGKTIVLTLNDAAYWRDKSNLPMPLPADAEIYVQVDSAHAETDYGAVLESHEIYGLPYNNIYGPVYLTPSLNTTITDTQRAPGSQSMNDLPPRD